MLPFFKNLYFFAKLFFLTIRSGLIYHIFILRFSNDTKNIYQIKKNIGFALLDILPRLGPVFIKIGQILSTRSDLIGKEISDVLSSLQDKIPPFSQKKIDDIFITEFYKTTKEIFHIFNKNSSAAASVAQVHKATLKSGETVAIKILRPNIRKNFSNNIRFIESITKLIKKRYSIKFQEIIEIIKKASEIELDLRLEAAATQKIRNNSQKDNYVYIPKVFWELTSEKILTTEWIQPIDTIEKSNKKVITEKITKAFFAQLYRDGFFHADIHQGNLIITNEENVALIDFGIVCTLSLASKNFITKVMEALLLKNYKKVADIHFQYHLITDKNIKQSFELACISIGETIVGKSSNELQITKMLKYLIEISKRFSIRLNPDLLLLHKTIFTLEGTLKSLYPEINMWNLLKPWIKNWNIDNNSLSKKIKFFLEEKRDFIDRSKYLLSLIEKNLSKK